MKEQKQEKGSPVQPETNPEPEQPQGGTPRVSRVREYMKAKFPERQWADDEEFDDALADRLAEADAAIEGHERANRTIMEVIEAYPELAEIIEDVAGGVPVTVALARQFSPEDLAVAEGEPDYDAYKKAAAERTKRLSDIRERTAARERNMAQSKTDVDAFFAERGMDEAEQGQFIEWVDNEILANLLDGKVDRSILTKLYQGWKFDEAVQDARTAGEVEGRNAQIEAKRMKADKTDGLPGSGGGIVPEPEPQPRDFLDDVLNRRSKRKF